jgi:hypothetical protein
MSQTSAALPAPRLQFRWVSDQSGEYAWVAIYELVLSLRQHDIRRGTAPNTSGEMRVELGRTRRGSGGFNVPNDTPYRDGVHAKWDGEQLGGLPVFVIDPNGQAWIETNPEPGMTKMVPALPGGPAHEVPAKTMPRLGLVTPDQFLTDGPAPEETPAVAVIRKLVAAWEALPGGRNYDKRVVQEWLIDDMKPAIDAARFALSDIDELSNLVERFSTALLGKLRAAEKKYGYSDAWMQPNWQADLVKHLMEHVAKGDPLDVAAYCAFAWHHGWPVASQPASPSQQDLETAVLTEREACAREADNYDQSPGDDSVMGPVMVGQVQVAQSIAAAIRARQPRMTA